MSDSSWPPWTAECQAHLSSTDSQNLLKLMSVKLVMLSNHLILCHPFLLLPSIFPNTKVFSMSWLFASGSHSIGASASASALPINIQIWFPLGLTRLISLHSKGLSKIFSSTTVRKYQIHSLAYYQRFWETIFDIVTEINENTVFS